MIDFDLKKVIQKIKAKCLNAEGQEKEKIEVELRRILNEAEELKGEKAG